MRKPPVGGPGFLDKCKTFLIARFGFVHAHAEAGELAIAVAAADAEVEPAVGQHIDRRRLFGQQSGIVPGQHHDRRPQPHAGGAGSEVAQQVQRSGDLAEAGEVMLDQEDAFEAEFFRFCDIIDEVVELLGIAGLGSEGGARATEQSESHCLESPLWCASAAEGREA